MKTLVIYHANCPDGFTAAWCCHKALDGNVELFEGFYGQDPPDVTGRDVLIVDFSYDREALELMYAQANSLRVLDHHKTAQKNLEGLPFCTFDMERSGAGLAWDELVPDKHKGPLGRPWLINYVEDRDLWRFDLHDSQLVSDTIMAEPMTLENWDLLFHRDLALVKRDGRAIRRKIDAYCRSMESNARVRPLTFVGKGQLQVPVINAPQIMISDLLHHLLTEPQWLSAARELERFDRAKWGPKSPPPFQMAVGWWQRGDGKYQHSLRSVGDFDVSTLAEQFGGGGHKNAAGFVADAPVW